MFSLPKPECESGYTQEQVKEIVDDYDDFSGWMDGKTMTICKGKAWDHDKEEYYEVCDGVSHGTVIYPCDLRRYLGSVRR